LKVRARFTAYDLAFAVLAVQFHEMQGGRFLNLNTQVAGDLPQGVIKVWKVVECHIAYECGANFIVARAAMQPPEKDEELDERGEANNNPVGIHVGVV
jgi:hypothetical protein